MRVREYIGDGSEPCYICQDTYMNRALHETETLLKALADVTRLRILGLLLTGEVCVCHIHESLRIPQPKASRHLAYLRRAGLVATRRDGLWIHYRLAELRDPVLRTIRDAVTHALGHVEAIHRDAERLRKKTGCCVPEAGELSLACCGGAVPSPETPALATR
jgi:ArsR family transcriptional regulator, arsenate/arsenite/antimonite-responsive transcriptional repressor